MYNQTNLNFKMHIKKKKKKLFVSDNLDIEVKRVKKDQVIEIVRQL